MQLNSLSTVGIATQVWAQATRTLTADPATDAGAATLVWGHATRQLTSLSTGVLALVHNTGVTIPASSVIDMRPVAGHGRIVSVSVQAGAAGTTVIGVYDGTTVRQMYSVASAQISGGMVTGDSTMGPGAKNNDAANAATAYIGGYEWLQ